MSSSWRPRTLILQHEQPTPPGHMTEWLAEQGAQIEVFRIDEDEDEVNPRGFDLIVSLGSEFAAFDDAVPFVQREVKLYEQAIESGVPILGLCFGGQMLARVLGSRLFRADEAEIGWLPVRTHDPHLVSTGPWFQWHFDSFSAPPGAKLIAETDAAPQAFVSGRNLGLQFHPEVTPAIMDEWVRAYPHELEAEGVDPQGLLTETRQRAAQAKQATWRLLDAFRDRVALGKERSI
ncbi:MAG TPA: type 1 glutamine amidotransferase [Candidatus Dormibacteraeota bacterium]|nr:type 1 glutamine amidotransferase [Candidatus Dormibacteraeota bacterium]